MAQAKFWPGFFIMKTYKNLYAKIISFENLILAWQKARKGKTKKFYVLEFEKELFCKLMALHYELKSGEYKPKPLKTFILRDPKTRKISKSEFRDRVVHHAICNILEPIFDKTFIFDSCANRKSKGTLFALRRFDKFIRIVSKNGRIKGKFNKNQVKGYCIKADIKHYFPTMNHEILLQIISKKIKEESTIMLIKKIVTNPCLQRDRGIPKGMPLGNLTSQFFANLYLNELDYFVKHHLKAKYYIRYVDDFVLLHSSKLQLEKWKNEINNFLEGNLKLELHPDKSKIISLSRGIDFVGFRNLFLFKLLRKRNIRKMLRKIESLKQKEVSYTKLMESFQGWQAYAKWANTFKLRRNIVEEMYRKYKNPKILNSHANS